jgi:diaminohydroxyphosphoribosylaminopyrimidine deaminase/5-amino-6-(5-phosphoribosylamino)uracil reductase
MSRWSPATITGQTPPCSEALIAAGVARVVVARKTPTQERRAGVRGLRAGGRSVETGVLEAEARRDQAGFLHPRDGGAAL